jgi:hypothetical protein
VRYTKVDGNDVKVKAKVQVQRAGVNVSGAVVTLTIGSNSYSLQDSGSGGIYYNCNVGSSTDYDGTNGPPAGTVDAAAGNSSGTLAVGPVAGTSDENSAACP